LLLSINEAVLKPLFPETHNLVSDWYVFNHYLLLTVFGFVLASTTNAWDWIAKQRRQSLALTCVIFVSAYALFKLQIIHRDTPIDALIANVFTWSAILAMLGYGKIYLTKSNRFIDWARDASYPIYILHQTFIVALAYYIVQQPWTAWSKFWLIWSATLVFCVVTYQLAVRRFAITRLLFGMKTGTKTQSPTTPKTMPLTKAST